MPIIKPVEQEWFDFPDDPLGGKVLVRHLKQGEIDRIIEKQLREPSEYGTTAEINAARVVDWKNFQGEDGDELECTRENVLLFTLEDDFNEFMINCKTELAGIVAEKRKAELKN